MVAEIVLHKNPIRALRRFVENRVGILDEAAALGSLTSLRLGPARAFVSTDPALARRILQTDPDNWIRPPAATLPIRLAIGHNLFTLGDEAWRPVHDAVAPCFRPGAIRQATTGIEALLDSEVEALPAGSTVDLELLMARLALMVAAEVMLGERLAAEDADRLSDHQRSSVDWVGARIGQVRAIVPFGIGRPYRRMRRHSAVLEAFADDVIHRRQEAGGVDAETERDVVASLLDATPGGHPLSHKELRSHLLGLLLAGNETTAAALVWVLICASRHPDLWGEVRTGAIPAEHFVNETLRLHPAVWGYARVPTRSTTVETSDGEVVGIRRIDSITIYLRAMNRDPERWDDPLTFDPRRHGGERSATAEMLSFGLGRRGCIGQQLALVEMHAAVRALARHFDVVVDQEIEPDASFALRVQGGLRGRLIRVS